MKNEIFEIANAIQKEASERLKRDLSHIPELKLSGSEVSISIHQIPVALMPKKSEMKQGEDETDKYYCFRGSLGGPVTLFSERLKYQVIFEDEKPGSALGGRDQRSDD